MERGEGERGGRGKEERRGRGRGGGKEVGGGVVLMLYYCCFLCLENFDHHCPWVSVIYSLSPISVCLSSSSIYFSLFSLITLIV